MAETYSMVPLNKLDKVLKSEDVFCIIRVEQGTVYKDGEMRVYEITLPESSIVSVGSKETARDEVLLAPRKYLETPQEPEWVENQAENYKDKGIAEIAAPENPLRWAAGGALAVTEDRYAIFIQRDKNAPSYPGHLTGATGLSENLINIKNPLTIVNHELQEELTATGGDTLYVWKPEKSYETPRDLAERRARLTGLKYSSIKPVDVKQISVGNNILRVYDHDGTLLSENAGIIAHDPATAGLDFLQILELGITYDEINRGEINIFDTEMFGTQRAQRDLVFIATDTLKDAYPDKYLEGDIYNKWTGICKEKMALEPHFTPVADAMIRALIEG